MSNVGNFYGGQLQGLERMTLAEDLIFKTFRKIKGKFFTELLNPMHDLGFEKPRIVNKGQYKKSNFVELVIPPMVLVNCVKPKIRVLYVDANGISL